MGTLWKDFSGVVKNVFSVAASKTRFFGILTGDTNKPWGALTDSAYSNIEDGTLSTFNNTHAGDNAKYALMSSKILSAADAVAAVSQWSNVTKSDFMNLVPTVERAITALSGLTPGCVYISGGAINGLDNGAGETTASSIIGDLIYATGAASGFVLSHRMFSSMQLSSGFTGTCTAIDTITAGAIYGNEGTKDLTGYTTMAWKRRLISTTTVQNLSGVMKYTIGGTGAAPTLTAVASTTGFPSGATKPVEVSSVRVLWSSANTATTLVIKDPAGAGTLISQGEISMVNTDESQKDDTFSYTGSTTGSPTISGTGSSAISGTLWIYYSQVV